MSWVAVLGGGGTSAGGGGQSSRGSSDMGRYLLGTSTTPRTPTTVSSARYGWSAGSAMINLGMCLDCLRWCEVTFKVPTFRVAWLSLQLYDFDQ